MIRSIPNPDMTREDIIRFHGVMRKCIVQDFTDTEKEQIELRRREMQRVGNIVKCSGTEDTNFLK